MAARQRSDGGFQLVVGDKEAEAGEVNVRVRGQEKAEGSVKVEAFVDRVKGLIESKSATLIYVAIMIAMHAG